METQRQQNPNSLLLREYYARAAASSVPTSDAPSSLSPAHSSAANSPCPSASSPPHLDCSSPSFDCGEYVRSILASEVSVAGLMRRDVELASRIRVIDGERKTLVYENYPKLINASETIRSMRTNIDTVERELSLLGGLVQDITGLAADLHSTFSAKKHALCSLKASTTLLRRLNVLSGLPMRLARSAADGSYLKAVRFYALTLPTLQRYRHVPLFEKAAADAMIAVANIRSQVLGKLRSPDLSYAVLLESTMVLAAINQDSCFTLLNLYYDCATRLASRCIAEPADWLQLAASVHCDGIKLFCIADAQQNSTSISSATATSSSSSASSLSSSPNSLSYLPRDPCRVYLTIHEFSAMQTRAHTLLENIFTNWEAAVCSVGSRPRSFAKNLEAHVRLRKLLPTVPEIADTMRALSQRALDASFDDEMTEMARESADAVRNAAYTSLDSAAAAMVAELSNLSFSLNTLASRLGGDSQAQRLNDVIPNFYQLVLSLPLAVPCLSTVVAGAACSSNATDGNAVAASFVTQQTHAELAIVGLGCRLVLSCFDTQIAGSFGATASSVTITSESEPARATQSLCDRVKAIALSSTIAGTGTVINSIGAKLASKICAYIEYTDFLAISAARAPSGFWADFCRAFLALREIVLAAFPLPLENSPTSAASLSLISGGGALVYTPTSILVYALSPKAGLQSPRMQQLGYQSPPTRSSRHRLSGNFHRVEPRRLASTVESDTESSHRRSLSASSSLAVAAVKSTISHGPNRNASAGNSTGNNSSSINSTSNSTNNSNNTSSNSNNSGTSESPEQSQSQISTQFKIHSERFFAVKPQYYVRLQDETDFPVFPILPCILRVALKAFVEHIRFETLGKHGFQQVQVDTELCKQQLAEFARDQPTGALFDEIVTSAYRRCVDPVFLKKEAIQSIIRVPQIQEVQDQLG